MNGGLPRILALTGVTALPAAAGEPAPPCDPDASRHTIPGPSGYQLRREGGDAYCEGTFNRPVAKPRVVRFEVLSLVARREMPQPGADVVLSVNWPHTGSETQLRAQPRRPSQMYQLDATEGTPDLADRPGGLEEFEWPAAVLAGLDRENYVRWEDVFVRACVPAGSARGPCLSGAPADEPVWLPTIQNPAVARAPAATGLIEDVTLKLWLTCTHSVHATEAFLEPVGEPAREPVALPPEAVIAGGRSVCIRVPPSAGVWRLTFKYRESGVKAAPSPGPALYYYVPGPEFCRWEPARDATP